MSKRRPYLRWIHERGAVLVVPRKMDCNTPEAFYHNEMVYRSPLYERAVARGIRFRVNGRVMPHQLNVTFNKA